MLFCVCITVYGWMYPVSGPVVMAVVVVVVVLVAVVTSAVGGYVILYSHFMH